MSANQSSNRSAFILLTSLFFLWGFVHNLDPILIPHLKKAFSLSTLEAALVDSSIFIAYFFMALPAGMLIRRYGYKTTILMGLLLFALGSFLFVPAAANQLYIFFLGALFVIGSGLALLETAANPYAALLGDPATSSRRLNFAQAFNGLAVTIAPIIGAGVILTKDIPAQELNRMTPVARQVALAAEASSVQIPYSIIGAVIVLVAFIFLQINMPDIREKGKKILGWKELIAAWQVPHLRNAVIAQFFYVGAQVCVNSLFILYAAKSANMDKSTAATYLGVGYGVSFMLGRFIGTFFMQWIAPAKLLTLYAFLNIILCCMAVYGQGMAALYTVFAISFFMSIMFPTIFSLGIRGLGNQTEIGSSWIVMAIVGGGILPLLFGLITDLTGNIQYGYFVPMTCFIVVAWFGWKGHIIHSTHKS
ncbi:MAG: L-fucose:H+ symporter permease [Chitinophagaceae bacterium]|nr:L-fucose:H+ symporter permease [Chitinophagaceae bacterium]